MPRNPDKIDYSGGLPLGFESFQVLEDPRTGNHKKHHFGEVLFMVVTATLCGMNNFAEIEDFCELQLDWLRKWIKIPHGIPTAQTFANIFAVIDPHHFNDCLRSHLATISKPLRDEIIAIDGKSLRGSHTAKQGPVHVVSAWATKQRLTLCQDHVPKKKNEIWAIEKVLAQLDLKGHTVTIDAMGAQRNFAEIIIAKNANYLFALKGNQEALHKEAIDHFHIALRHLKLEKAAGWSIHQDYETDHGRKTLCSIVATDRLDWMDPGIRGKWSGLKSLIVVENQTVEKANGRRRRLEKRYYLSSLSADAKELRETIRAHWQIENNCHWQLDTSFREDANQTRAGNAAKNLGTVRRIVLNMLNQDGSTIKSLPKKRRQALLNYSYRESILSLA
jgi:predicted transposase YbfD/YdcC